MKPSLYIVIRYGSIDAVDAIDEIEKIIRKRGRVWFGKYGQPLATTYEKIVRERERKVYAVLIRKGKSGESQGYVFKAYRVLQIVRQLPRAEHNFPKYYLERFNKIGAWVEVRKYDGPQFALDDLVTKSSLQKLPKSLAGSMKAHFYCKLGS